MTAFSMNKILCLSDIINPNGQLLSEKLQHITNKKPRQFCNAKLRHTANKIIFFELFTLYAKARTVLQRKTAAYSK